MADIEFTDGSSFNFDKQEGETLSEFYRRQVEETEAEYEKLKEGLKSVGWGKLFGE